MERRKAVRNERRQAVNQKLANFQMVISDVMSRASLAQRLGWQYDGYRKIYKALGYPEDEKLDFKYFWNKYDRQDVATAIIDRPCDATWNGSLKIIEPDTQEDDSKLIDEWTKLDDKFRIKQKLNRLDKLAGIGHYAVLLFGFADVKKKEDFERPIGETQKVKLAYLRPFSEADTEVLEWETDTSNERYGQPRIYKIRIGKPGESGTSTDQILVHHSRVLHVADSPMLSDFIGRPRLKPIVNRLEDLEKLMGGSAEMYWRGARPGYHAKPEPDYEFGDDEIDQLEDELDKFEHDLRRFLTSQGVDIQALAPQISDPSSHIDVQLQAISAQTGIPKRILVGSERGELSSTQDKGQWLSLIKTRMEEWAEPFILRPIVDMLMKHGILTATEDYNIMWEDLFAPSEKEKAEVGKIRADALKSYVAALGADEVLPRDLVYKYLLGLSEEQVEEAIKAADEQAAIEEAEADDEAEMERQIQEEVDRRLTQPPQNGNGQNGNGQQPPQRRNQPQINQ